MNDCSQKLQKNDPGCPPHGLTSLTTARCHTKNQTDKTHDEILRRNRRSKTPTRGTSAPNFRPKVAARRLNSEQPITVTAPHHLPVAAPPPPVPPRPGRRGLFFAPPRTRSAAQSRPMRVLVKLWVWFSNPFSLKLGDACIVSNPFPLTL